MENASKALIIAGAILLAILIIGLAVFIYNQAANTVSDTGMDQVAARQFNGQFEPYINKNCGSSTIEALIDTVNESNRTSDREIILDGVSNKNQIILGHKYYAEPRYSDGVIRSIYITDLNNQDQDDPGVGELLDILPESFNSQFEGFVDVIMPTSGMIAAEVRTGDQIRELWDRVERSNRTYENHQIIFRIREEILDDYNRFLTIVNWDENDYINMITVNADEK